MAVKCLAHCYSHLRMKSLRHWQWHWHCGLGFEFGAEDSSAQVGGMHRHDASQWHLHLQSCYHSHKQLHPHSHCPGCDSGWDCGAAAGAGGAVAPAPAPAAPSPDSHSNLPKDRGTDAHATGGGAAAAAGRTHAAVADAAHPPRIRFACVLYLGKGTETMLDIQSYMRYGSPRIIYGKV